MHCSIHVSKESQVEPISATWAQHPGEHFCPSQWSMEVSASGPHWSKLCSGSVHTAVFPYIILFCHFYRFPNSLIHFGKTILMPLQTPNVSVAFQSVLKILAAHHIWIRFPKENINWWGTLWLALGSTLWLSELWRHSGGYKLRVLELAPMLYEGIQSYMKKTTAFANADL